MINKIVIGLFVLAAGMLTTAIFFALRKTPAQKCAAYLNKIDKKVENCGIEIAPPPGTNEQKCQVVTEQDLERLHTFFDGLQSAETCEAVKLYTDAIRQRAAEEAFLKYKVKFEAESDAAYKKWESDFQKALHDVQVK